MTGMDRGGLVLPLAIGSCGMRNQQIVKVGREYSWGREYLSLYKIGEPMLIFRSVCFIKMSITTLTKLEEYLLPIF